MRRLISLVSAAVALLALGLVLYNATLVDRRAPAVSKVSLSAPATDDRTAQPITAIDIEFSEPVRPSTVVARFRIQPYVAGAFSWDGATAIFTPSARLPGDTEFTITIEPGFEDLIGNAAEMGLDPWRFRTVGPPIVVRVDPAEGESGLPVDGSVDVEFDRLMDTASVEAAIRLDPPVAVIASWSGETVRLTFDGGLRFGTTYTLTIGSGAADTGGNRLRDPYVTRFSTVAAGLGVVDAIPAPGVSGVAVGTPIAIRFDAPIDAATARASFRMTPSVDGDVRVIRVADDLGGAQPGSPVVGADTLVFVPSAPLAPHTTYTVTLEPTVARLDDPEAVAAGRSWTFTTGAPTASGQNQIAFLGARSGVRNIWLMNPDGTNPRQLTTELVPVSGFDASGDASRIVYSAAGLLRVVGINGSDAGTLTGPDAFEYAPTITPDDKWVIVGRRGRDGADLGYWLVPLPGTSGRERQLLDHGAPALGSSSLGGEGIGGTDGTSGWMPRSAVDPTGRFVLLVASGGEIVAIDLQAPGDVPVATPVPLTADAAAAWSPRHGAFVVAARPASGGSSALWVVDPTGGLNQVPGTEGAAGPVGVGADGTVAVSIRVSSVPTARIGILAPGAPTMRLLDGTPARDDRWPAISPDGATAVIGRTFDVRPEDGDGIWSVDLATGSASQLSPDGAFARWLP